LYLVINIFSNTKKLFFFKSISFRSLISEYIKTL